MYMKACYEHLLSKQPDQANSLEGENNYYKKEDEFALERAKKHIISVLKEGLDKYIIAKEEYTAMDPSDKTASRFYCNLKIHKPHEEVPPVRPIVSGCGSMFENVGIFVEHHIKDLATKHSKFIQDTPDF